MTNLTASLMNRWDYVLAITEDQVNNGLRIAYDSGNVGKALPRMPKGQQTLSLDSAGTRQLVVNMGCPHIHATHEELKQCDLVIPLSNSSLVEGGITRLLPPEMTLTITTSLSSSETSVEAGATPGATPPLHHEAWVDFKAKEAAYKVNFSNPEQAELRPLIAAALRDRLRQYHERAFRVASFDAPAEAGPFVPLRVDVCFVPNAGQPGRSAILFAAALEKLGAAKENSLEFKPEILPADVPAALWVGPRVVLERLVLPMLRQSMTAGANPPLLRFLADKGEIQLAERCPMPAVDGKSTVLEALRVYAANGNIAVDSGVRVFKVGPYDDNAYITDRGHISFSVNPDHTTFSASSVSDLHQVGVESTSPGWWRWMRRIGSLGLSEAVDAIVNKAIRDKVSGVSANSLSQKLQLSAGKISAVAQRLPVLEDLSVGGHLLFDRVTFVDGGAAFLGIRATGAATGRSETVRAVAAD